MMCVRICNNVDAMQSCCDVDHDAIVTRAHIVLKAMDMMHDTELSSTSM